MVSAPKSLKITQPPLPQKLSMLPMEILPSTKQSTSRRRRGMSWTDAVLANDDEELETAELVDRVHEEADVATDLRVATGSEITDFRQQINTDRAKEKAMGATLPGPTVHSRKKSSTSRRSKRKNRLGESSHRVTPEEEIKLARIIQRGAALHRIKTEFEAKNGHEIGRQEWADLANLKSHKDLRRLVSDYRRAKNELVSANMGLVYAVVRRSYQGFTKNTGISEEELIQEGSLGLVRAAELFDPSRGLRFSTYATIWIKGVLTNSKIDQTIALPQREKIKWNKIRKASTALKADHSNDDLYNPTAREIASAAGLEPNEVVHISRKMASTSKLLSLDYRYESHSRSGEIKDEHEGILNDKALVADADLAERLSIRADVITALAKNLDPNEARLIRLRYGLKDGNSRTLVECAEIMGIHKDKARYIAKKCLKKLREADDAESLQEYLLTVA